MPGNRPHISICIPAYKRTEFLKRLLDSITIQKFRDFEVIISDDSPANEVENMANDFRARLPALIYHRNPIPLGTPENWNEAIRQARGKWIKIMHDDDWFNGVDSLANFAEASREGGEKFIFSSYFDVYLSGNKSKRIIPPAFRFRMLKKEPAILVSKNIIGPPSVIMCRNDGNHQYDARLKWLVDIDMYIRRLQQDKIVYLPEPLINVGIGADQVTSSVHGVPEVEVPEHFYFLEKHGIKTLKNILVYDAWWRFIRNFKLLSPTVIENYGYKSPIHPVISSMISWQKKISTVLLRNGVFSKSFMFLHFITHKNRIRE
jgi:glycosyltransferase involved in cell wall biosynthesis